MRFKSCTHLHEHEPEDDRGGFRLIFNAHNPTKYTVLSLDVGPSRAGGVMGSAGSELVVFGLDLAQVLLFVVVWRLADPIVGSFKLACMRGARSSIIRPSVQPHTHSPTHKKKQHRIHEEKRLALPRPGAADLRIRPDEKLFVVGGWDHRVRAFSFGGRGKKKPPACTPLAVLKCHAESAQALAFAGGGTGGGGGVPFLLASGGKDARIALWDLYPPES